jgi:hypothetical protein
MFYYVRKDRERGRQLLSDIKKKTGFDRNGYLLPIRFASIPTFINSRLYNPPGTMITQKLFIYFIKNSTST